MKRKLFYLLLLVFFYVTPHLLAEETINMKSGQEEFRKLDSIKRISVADPYVADAKVLSGGRQLMIKAGNPGQTTITIFDDDEKKTVFIVNVISTLSEEAQRIALQLKGVDTVNVRVIDDQIVIEGVLLREQDKKPLAKVRELYKDVKFLLEDKIQENQNYIIEGIQAELPANITAKLLGDGVMLEGTVSSAQKKSDAERIAREYVDNVYSVLKIQEVNPVATVNPIELIIEENQAESSNQGVKILSEGLKIEKGIFGLVLEDDIAADNMIQELTNNFSAISAFDGRKDYTKNGQYELNLDSGETLYIYFQFEIMQDDLFKVSLSLLDSQKKVLSRNEFYSKRMEALGISGFYNMLRSKKKVGDNGKELLLVFDLKS